MVSEAVCTFRDPGQDYEAPGQDSGDAFSSVSSYVVFIKTLYVSTAAERKGSSTVYLACVVTADKEAAVTTHELTHATSHQHINRKKGIVILLPRRIGPTFPHVC